MSLAPRGLSAAPARTVRESLEDALLGLLGARTERCPVTEAGISAVEAALHLDALRGEQTPTAVGVETAREALAAARSAVVAATFAVWSLEDARRAGGDRDEQR